jgi:FkbM family methyltransferase
MYSQNNEEEIILSHIGDKVGRFLEIGSYDPISLSNTRALVERGWAGVYVEPSPRCMRSFMSEYEGNEKIELCMAAITKKRGVMAMHDADAVSTFSDSHKSLWENSVSFTPVPVQCITIKDFIGLYGDAFDFISIDVEGTNLELLQEAKDILFTNTSLVCIEHEGKEQEMISIFETIGFTAINQNGENIIFKR